MIPVKFKKKDIQRKKNKSIQERIDPLTERYSEELSVNRKNSLLLSLGMASFGVLFALYDDKYFLFPFILFAIGYFSLYRILSRDYFSEKKQIIEIISTREEGNQKLVDDVIETIKKEINEINSKIDYLVTIESNVEREALNLNIQDLQSQLQSLQSGLMGEEDVENCLISTFSDACILLNDISIPSSQGRTTQIDHIVITPKKIIVIETKNISGKFYPYNHNKWRWTPYSGGYSKELFLINNPIHQCLYHSDKLNALLSPISNMPIESLVVITSPNFSYKGRISRDCPIVHLSQFSKELKLHDIEGEISSEQKMVAEHLLQVNVAYSKKHYASI